MAGEGERRVAGAAAHPSASRRASPSKERADRIIAAAAELFARKGYQRATTKEIAATAGLAEGTIFNYFPTKRALLLATMAHLVTGTLPQLFAQPASDERQLVRAVIRDRFELFERIQPLMPVLLQELAIDEELRRQWVGQVVVPMIDQVAAASQQRMASSDFRAHSPRVVLPATAGAVIMTLLANELLRPFDLPSLGPPVDRGQLIDQLVDFILYGLSGRPREESTTSGGTER